MKLPSSSSLPSLLLYFILLLVVLCNAKTGRLKLPPNLTVPAVFVFGDSIMDTGNNNYIKTTSRCNYQPYGEDFEERKPSGRCSNGKIPSDLLVEALGIKELLPPYLDPNLEAVDSATGVCFASSGAGYDPLTSKHGDAIPLSGQLDLFKDYTWKLKQVVGEERSKFIIANSVYIVVSGSNDIAETYFFFSERKKQFDFPAYSDFLVSSASDFVKELNEVGAERIGVFSVPPIGCVPFVRTVAGGIARNCAQEYNDAVQLFNNKLSKELLSLNHNLPSSRIVYIDIYNPFIDILANYQKYGFKVGDRGCCGTGNIEVTASCRWQLTCANHSEYVFWDSFHPTQLVYNMLFVPVIQKYVPMFL